MMQVVCAKPPLYDEIDAAFGIAGKPVIFAFGDTIYNPQNIAITRELLAHEFVHGQRQGEFPGGVTEWWTRYIADPQFRLAEEIPAHQLEYLTFCQDNRQGQARNGRRLYLHTVAKRLASPLYGSMISYEKARAVIKASPA